MFKSEFKKTITLCVKVTRVAVGTDFSRPVE